MTNHEMFNTAYAAGVASFARYSELFDAKPDTNSLVVRLRDLAIVQQSLFNAGREDNYDELVIKIAFDCGWSDAELAR